MVTFNVYKSTSSGAYVEGVCLATDTKPIAGITNGSILYAVDITDGSVKRYMFNQNAATWVEAEDPCAGGGSGGVFWVTYGTTTIDELNAAYQAGKTLMLEYQNYIYYLEYRTSTMYVFQCMNNGQTSGVGITLKQILYTSTYDTWAYYDYDALAANQYPQNAGKFLAVGNDGKVTPVNAPSGGGAYFITPTASVGGPSITESYNDLKALYDAGTPVYLRMDEEVPDLLETHSALPLFSVRQDPAGYHADFIDYATEDDKVKASWFTFSSATASGSMTKPVV